MSYSYSDPPSCCSAASAELKLYQAFIFSTPIFFTFILLFLFYLFYLRRQRVDWSSLRMRAVPYQNDNSTLSESGLKKELREMLPIIVFKETFSISDTQCSVCLGDYQAEDKLQQIPACGHTFHMDCIDHWLATHTTCPLCRLSLVPPPKKTDSDPVSATDQVVEAPATESQADEGPSPVIANEDLESQSRGEAAGGEEGARTRKAERRSSCSCNEDEEEEEEEEEDVHIDTTSRGGEEEEFSVVDDVEAQRSNARDP